MIKPSFENNHIYHIYNRGVEKRVIFNDKSDYFRFINSLDEFNNIELALPSNTRFKIRNPSRLDLSLGVQLLNLRPKKPLVKLLAFCLMPNHYHLLIEQIEDNGVVKFMQKLGTGYTNYFNLKNDRVGPLFQGRFKAVLLTNDIHFRYLPHYIHFNPLDLINSEWRNGKIDLETSTEFLETYRWSSYLDYMGKDNFPLLTSRNLILEMHDNSSKKFKKDMFGKFNLDGISELLLE